MAHSLIALDTHVLLWWTQEPERLGVEAARAIDETEELLIPTIVFWETALLVRKQRYALKGSASVDEWTQAVLSIPRIHSVPLSAQLAVRADALDMHADPADRFIVATAMEFHSPLVTKDTLLRSLTWLPTIW